MPLRSSRQEGSSDLPAWVAPRLLAWFRQHRRDLPWRRDRDPYRIWVSEIMLQQTLVATVVPFFTRFLDRFPTLNHLAQADEQEVLRLWEGLGYYRRARHLLQSARILAEHHAGTFPTDPDALRGLPGMGDYTRNAILSQAFDQRLPILEANSIRVLSRLFGRKEDPRKTEARKWLWQAAEAILPLREVGDFNQALMELGALVCTPEKPACEDCPLHPRCAAFQSGSPEDYPQRAIPAPPTPIDEVAVVVRREGKVLLVQRPSNGRWSNLWEFPHAERKLDETHEQAAVRILRDLAGMEIHLGPELSTIRHTVTRFVITLVCFEAGHAAGDFSSAFYVQFAWVDPKQLGDYPVSSPQRKLARLISESGRQRRLF